MYAGFFMLIEKLDSSHATMKTTAEGAMAPHSSIMQVRPGGLNKKLCAVAITARRLDPGFVSGLKPATFMATRAPLSSFRLIQNSALFTNGRVHSHADRSRLSSTLIGSLCHV